MTTRTGHRPPSTIPARWRGPQQGAATITSQPSSRCDGLAGGFLVCADVPCSSPTVPVPAGNRVAGTLARTGYAELAWVPQAGWELALEARGQGRLPVNDLNSDFAAGFGLLALRARWTVTLPLGGLELLARVDNLADRQVAASVIVNEGNGRYFEPAPGRNMLLSARWRVHF